MELVMKKVFYLLCLSSVLTCVVIPAVAQGDEALSCDNVRDMLAGGSSATEVVHATVQTGMSLVDATVFAISCVGNENPEAIATAGIEAAGNLAQAQSVADAVLASAGQIRAVSTGVYAALQEYIKNMPQPEVYEDKYTPTGGDNAVSPAA
jgi:hypothetical protein